MRSDRIKPNEKSSTSPVIGNMPNN